MEEWNIPTDEPPQIIDPTSPSPITICVDDIILTDPAKLTAHDLLQHQCTVAYFVQVLTEKKLAEISDHLENIQEYLYWISKCSKNLANRIGQPLHKQPYTGITRSSYNFCRDSVQCSRFYDLSHKPTCNYHHYVHAQLKMDVDSVIQYITQYSTGGGELDTKNLLSSIKTICFVTRHMAKEMHYFHNVIADMTLDSNASELYHRNNLIRQPRLPKKPKEPTIRCNNRFSPLMSN